MSKLFNWLRVLEVLLEKKRKRKLQGEMYPKLALYTIGLLQGFEPFSSAINGPNRKFYVKRSKENCEKALPLKSLRST